ncbi:hypothetical protein [Synechococcus sp. PCC 6312]|uniref:hypothetical protein n=1 Tax=Synechococcus sp. (strain ATCC 27167 / PCC 6312) TaxID=195253 RepID=UPI0012EACA76|nr:hypothetical protein [Synechococcus sp. PCC 6312]
MGVITRVTITNSPRVIKNFPSNTFVNLSTIVKFERLRLSLFYKDSFVSSLTWITSKDRLIKTPLVPNNELLDLVIEKSSLTRFNKNPIPLSLEELD